MLSMTGYGRGEYKVGGVELTVEIKTVNNRYLDVSVKSPRLFTAYDENVRSLVREKMTRGHVDVFISLTDKRDKEKELRLDEGAANAYVEAARKVKALFPDIADDFSVTSVLRFPDVVKSDDIAAADDELISALESALKAALENLNIMREREGKKLAADMLSRVDTIEKIVEKVKTRAPAVAENYRLKLEEKLKKILADVQIDEGRILTEAAIFADKSNIDEELTRLASHISQFREIVKEHIVGRKLDFLVQEFNRESNTICSKSNDLAVTRLGLELKNEIEKIREQVQNVE
ncbi:MAG: YicC family protein [Clostridiales bacterium]|nr:YicC family protein [Clostridiales bacterium]